MMQLINCIIFDCGVFCELKTQVDNFDLVIRTSNKCICNNLSATRGATIRDAASRMSKNPIILKKSYTENNSSGKRASYHNLSQQ